MRVVTPSTYVHQGYLEEKEPSYLMAVAPGPKTDRRVSRGSIHRAISSLPNTAAAKRWEELEHNVATYRPREIVLPEDFDLPAEVWNGFGDSDRPVETRRENWRFDYEAARETLLKQFGTVSLDGFGIEGNGRWPWPPPVRPSSIWRRLSEGRSTTFRACVSRKKPTT